MKQASMYFAIVLIVSLASTGMAADRAPTAGVVDTFKADLSGAKLPPVETAATGEALFQLVRHGATGGGTGGTGTFPGDNTGMAGPNQGFGYEKGMNGSYKGLDKSKEIPGSAPGGAMAGDVLRYSLSVNDIKDVTAAHLHMGKSTSAEGPVVAPLFLGPEKGGRFSGTLAQGTITNKDLQGPLAGKTVDDLVALMNSGDVYVNVHTVKHPAGEIRGEVREVS